MAQGLPSADALYDSAPCGLLLADARGHILKANRTLCDWLGRQPGEMPQLRVQDLLDMGARIFYQTHLQPLLRMQDSVAEVKLQVRHKDGATLPMMLNLQRLDTPDGPLLHVAFFIARDRHKYERELLLERQRAEVLAAERAAAQRELERAQEETSRARAAAEDRALFAEQMMGIVSHDLRNPLSTILLSTALLAQGAGTAQQQKVVRRIGSAAERATRLIGDLLDFTQARLGSGLAVHPQPIDLHATVSTAVAELAAAFPQRQLLHEAQGEGRCEADADRLTQLIGNLVGNAMAYGAPDAPVVVRSRTAPGEWELSVHNQGDPIPPDLVPTLFEPMVRGQQESSGGVGLGLFIVSEIARAHGGRMEVHSTAQEGTTFRAVFPRT